MAEQELDRNEAATPYKLQKAKERGQVAKSADVVSSVVFLAATVYLIWQGRHIWSRQFRFDYDLLAQTGRIDAGPDEIWHLLTLILQSTFLLSAPFFLTLLLAAILGNLLQTGPVLSIEPIKADWKRINPASGFKRLFSMRTLFNGLRTLLKLTLLSIVVYFALKDMMPHFYTIAGLSAMGVAQTLLVDLGSLCLKMAAILGFIALLDLIYTKREFSRQMRMSRREIKDEFKNREGDPRIRARLRELRQETFKRSMSIRSTSSADVLITNPTHIAVALRYVHGEMESPRLIAKGSGVLAAVMRQIAARHNIPVVRNPALARSLFHDLPVDYFVPPQLYAQVARIIVWVFAMRDARNPQNAAATQKRPS